MRNQFIPFCAWPAFILFISSSRTIASIPPSSTHVRWAKANTYQAHACIFIDCARHLCWQPNYEEEQETQRNSTPQAGNCVSVRGGRGSEKDIKREKSESWQLCQQLINLSSVVFIAKRHCMQNLCARTHTHSPAADYHSTLHSVCPLFLIVLEEFGERGVPTPIGNHDITPSSHLS